MVHPIHITPDPKNTRADRTLALIRMVSDRLNFGQSVAEIHDDLVPDYADEETFFLAVRAAGVR